MKPPAIACIEMMEADAANASRNIPFMTNFLIPVLGGLQDADSLGRFSIASPSCKARMRKQRPLFCRIRCRPCAFSGRFRQKAPFLD
jgi:hypothetical protein